MKFLIPVLLISFYFAGSGSAEEHQLTGKLILKNTAHILTSPARWDKKDWAYFSFATAAVLGTMAYADKPVFEEIQQEELEDRVNVFDFIEPFGLQYACAILGTFYFVGEVFDKPQAQRVARDGIATALISLGVVEGVKAMTGRSRPRRRIGAFEFEPFSGQKSFPSGHTATAFGFAAVVSSHYHPIWFKIGAYSVAGLVGLSRIDHNAHFVSDVVAGAFIGTAIGYSIVNFNRSEKAEQSAQWFLLPIYTPETKGLSMTIVF